MSVKKKNESDRITTKAEFKSYVEHLNKNKEPIHEEPIFIEGEKDGISVEIAMQYNDGYASKLFLLPIILIRMKVVRMNQV